MGSRRAFLRSAIISIAALSIGQLLGCHSKEHAESSTIGSLLDDIGPLLPPDDNGLMLPSGFTSRIVARSGLPPHAESSYLWHDAPDGGATFKTEDGGWIYVSNSEVANNLGGVGAIRFDPFGNILQAYSILDNTNRNCAGGATPWGTWLSCEEVDNGTVWECDPLGQLFPIQRLSLGTFNHEAIAVDTQTNYLYLTEDKPDGGFYRFVPDSIFAEGRPDLATGSLEVAVVDPSNSTVSWVPVPDPNASTQPTRYQINSSTEFNGGEGIVFYNGIVSFTTKGDDRIWSYDIERNDISVVYDASTHQNTILTGVDNITLSKEGELVVAEDGGNLQIVALSNANRLVPLIQLVGHDGSEVTGPAFSPDGSRLYFSSQRGMTGTSNDGITFEVMGPFHG